MRTIHLPDKPLMLWDKECDFCRYWIKRWDRWTKGKIEYKPFQEKKGDFPDVPEQNFIQAVCLIEADGEVYKGAEAALKAMRYGGKMGLIYRLYKSSKAFKFIADKSYIFISRRRLFFYKATVFLLGKE